VELLGLALDARSVLRQREGVLPGSAPQCESPGRPPNPKAAVTP